MNYLFDKALLFNRFIATFIFCCGFLLVAACDGAGNVDDENEYKDDLVYTWSVDKPEGSADVFKPYKKGAELIPDVEGDYYIKLNISGDDKEEEPETVTIKVTAKAISGSAADGLDTFSFGIGQFKKTKYIDKKDPDEEYPFIWAPYPFPFESDVYSEDIFIRMSFVYESSLSSMDFFINGAKEGSYECGDKGVSHGETSIAFEDPNNEYQSNNAGSCKITISRFSSTGRVVGQYEAVVINDELNKSVQILGEFDVQIELPE